MDVVEFEDAISFLATVEDFLLENEAENCLMVGIARSLATRPSDQKPLLAAVLDDEVPIAACIRTPPFDVVLSFGIAPEAVGLIVDRLSESSPELPGVLGDKGPADAFAAAWAEKHGVKADLFRAERIYKTTTVNRRATVDGEARRATEADRERFEEWLAAFGRDVGEEMSIGEIEETADIYLSGPEYQTFMWWVDGRPVSMASVARPTPNGALVRAVYTPPEFRSHGYGSAVTAALTRHVLDEGRSMCFLFTDLANATSNSIYHQIGYRPVCDVSHHRFSASPLPGAKTKMARA